MANAVKKTLLSLSRECLKREDRWKSSRRFINFSPLESRGLAVTATSTPVGSLLLKSENIKCIHGVKLGDKGLAVVDIPSENNSRRREHSEIRAHRVRAILPPLENCPRFRLCGVAFIFNTRQVRGQSSVGRQPRGQAGWLAG